MILFQELNPCSTQYAVVHIANVVFNSVTIILCAWLTRRAKRIDRQNGQHNGNAH